MHLTVNTEVCGEQEEEYHLRYVDLPLHHMVLMFPHITNEKRIVFKPECSWIFEGIGADEVIGDFGLVGGGAAGLELDRYDLEFGTPHNAYYLARSQDHSNMMLQVNEEIHFAVRGYYGGGHEKPNGACRYDLLQNTK